ncbi:MAG: hypothetical protein LN417_10215 [Candidatus Thermoplasmatota archaeon]|nr:hypothetical protein [Candidatus Thermoplasmatota archaeon]
MLENIVAQIFRSQGFSVELEKNRIRAQKAGKSVFVAIISEGELDTFLGEVTKEPWFKIAIPTYEFSGKEQKAALDRKVLLWGLDEVEDRIKGELFEVLDLPHDMEEAEKAKEVIVRPVLTKDDIREIGKKTVRGFNFMLQLVPHFVYEFESVLHVHGEEDRVVDGCIAVNALTSQWETWEMDFETVEAIDTTHETLEPKIDEESASEIAREAARELGTKEVESVHEADHATIVERRIESPEEEDVSTKHAGLVYLPVWCVEGTLGAIIVNSNTGKIVREDYYET